MKFIIKKIFLALVIYGFGVDLHCQNGLQNDSTKTINGINSLEITGLLIDRTQSKIGKEFYELFFTLWEQPKVDFDFAILFEEKTSPGVGTQISVTINDLLIFQQFVQPRYDKIEEMVQIALQTAVGHLEYYAQILDELKFEELDGTGIY